MTAIQLLSFEPQRITTSLVVAYAVSFTIALENLSLLGLMAKIKCSICSYQFNIWYAGHRPAHILIWFLAFGQGSEACLTLTTGCLGIALQPSAAHYLTNENHQPFNHNYCNIGRYGDIPIFRSSENSDMILTWNLKGLKLIRNYIWFWISSKTGKS